MISRKNVKLFKLFIVSPILERILLAIYIVSVPLLCFYQRFVENIHSPVMGRQFMNMINSNYITNISTSKDVVEWLRLVTGPNLLNQNINPNLNLCPIYILISNFNIDDCSILNTNKYEQNYQSSCMDTEEHIDSSISQQYPDLSKPRGEFISYPISSMKRIYYGLNFSDSTSLDYLYSANDIPSEGITNFTQNIQVAGFYRNYWSTAVLSFKINFEFGTPNKIVNWNINYRIFHLALQNGPVYLTTIVVFLIQLVLFILKILFEASFSPSKIIIISYVIFIGLESSFGILYMVQYSAFARVNYINSTEITQFINLNQIFALNDVNELLLGLLMAFVPFRLLTWFSWYRYSAPINKFWSIIYRILPSLLLYFLICLVVIAACSIFLYIGFHDYFYQMKDFAHAFFNIMVFDFTIIQNNATIKTLQTSFGPFFYIFLCIHALIVDGILAYYICLLIDLIRRSANFETEEISPYESEQIEKAEELTNKFDKFLKELPPLIGVKKQGTLEKLSSMSTEKMLIWLDCNKGKWSEENEQLFAKLNSKDIKTMVFSTLEEVEEFLKYLFSLKPGLLTSKASSRFRIVGENFVDGKRYDLIYIEMLMDWLTAIGCRVPFMVYSRVNLTKEDIMAITNKYASLYIAYDMKQLKKYCIMEDNLYLFKKIITSTGKYEVLLESGEISGSESMELNDQQIYYFFGLKVALQDDDDDDNILSNIYNYFINISNYQRKI